MKSASRTKVGGKKGNPGYRTQATFLGATGYAKAKNQHKIAIDKNKVKYYTKDSQ